MKINDSKANTLTDATKCLDSLGEITAKVRNDKALSVCGGYFELDRGWSLPFFKRSKYNELDGYFRFQKNGPIEFIGVNVQELINANKLKNGSIKCSIEHTLISEGEENGKKNFYKDKKYFHFSYYFNSNDNTNYELGYFYKSIDEDDPSNRCSGSLLKELRGDDVTKAAMSFLKMKTINALNSFIHFLKSNNNTTASIDNKNCPNKPFELKEYANRISNYIKSCSAYKNQDKDITKAIDELTIEINKSKNFQFTSNPYTNDSLKPNNQ